MSGATSQKGSTRQSTCGANTSHSNTSSHSARDFSPRPDLEAQIIASTSPVSSVDEARTWLGKKGWVLSSESYSKNKLADILFSILISFKLPPEADTAIRAVAYLIRDQSDKETSITVTEKIIDKIADRLVEPISKLSDSIEVAKNFLDATSQQQASELVSLQESVKLQTDIAKSLADSSEKISIASDPKSLANADWPPLASTGNNNMAHQLHPASLLHRRGSPIDPRVLQRISLASKQLLLDYGLLDEGEQLHSRSIEAQRELKQRFNKWLDDHPSIAEGGDPPPPSRAVRNVAVFDRPAMLLEFESSKAKTRFVDICDKNASLLREVSPRARIRPQSYAVIFRFVPCKGPFDPNSEEHIRNIEKENDLNPNSIISASWCKRPENSERTLPSH